MGGRMGLLGSNFTRGVAIMGYVTLVVFGFESETGNIPSRADSFWRESCALLCTGLKAVQVTCA
ncbi:hypothetical protein J6590_052533 [Homalodisca vitripennis]|nr:hypothetical protein J6590_052533 [Homalodisca vitripennis]